MGTLPIWTGNFLIGPMAEAESTGQAAERVVMHRFNAAPLKLVQPPSCWSAPKSRLRRPSFQVTVAHFIYKAYPACWNATSGASIYSPLNINFKLNFFLPSRLTLTLAPCTRIQSALSLQTSQIAKLVIYEGICSARANVPYITCQETSTTLQMSWAEPGVGGHEKAWAARQKCSPSMHLSCPGKTTQAPCQITRGEDTHRGAFCRLILAIATQLAC